MRRPCPSLLAPLASLLLILSASCSRAWQPSPEGTSADLMRHEARLERLEQRLAALGGAIREQGRGVYASGPTLHVAGSAGGSLLQHLHELQQDIAALRGELAQSRGNVGVLEGHLRAARQEIVQLEDQLAILQGYRDTVRIAQDEVRAQTLELAQAKDSYAASEHRRLVLERHFADFMHRFLRMNSLDTQQFLDLQVSMRELIAEQWPAHDDRSAGNRQ